MSVPRLVKKPTLAKTQKPAKSAVPHIAAAYPRKRRVLYFAPEAPSEVFECIARDCIEVVPHREFFCAEHWARPGIGASSIKHLQRRYRAALGFAIEKIAKQDALDNQEAAGAELPLEKQSAP